ncbi:unnamed protein product, partial [Protopolystoma xenopodis]
MPQHYYLPYLSQTESCDSSIDQPTERRKPRWHEASNRSLHQGSELGFQTMPVSLPDSQRPKRPQCHQKNDQIEPDSIRLASDHSSMITSFCLADAKLEPVTTWLSRTRQCVANQSVNISTASRLADNAATEPRRSRLRRGERRENNEGIYLPFWMSCQVTLVVIR